MSTTKQQTVYQRIMAASRRDVGMRLSADEVAELAGAGMIISVAASDDESDEIETVEKPRTRSRR